MIIVYIFGITLSLLLLIGLIAVLIGTTIWTIIELFKETRALKHNFSCMICEGDRKL